MPNLSQGKVITINGRKNRYHTRQAIHDRRCLVPKSRALHNGGIHEYHPDFLARLQNGDMLILETKGFDPLKAIKIQAADDWIKAVNAGKRNGAWHYAIVEKSEDITSAIDAIN